MNIFILTIVLGILGIKCQLSCDPNFLISNGTENYFTIFSQNKSCKCDNFIGDGSKLTNVATLTELNNLKEEIVTLKKQIDSLKIPDRVLSTSGSLSWIVLAGECRRYTMDYVGQGSSFITLNDNVNSKAKNTCTNICIEKGINIKPDPSQISCINTTYIWSGGSILNSGNLCESVSLLETSIGLVCCCFIKGIAGPTSIP